MSPAPVSAPAPTARLLMTCPDRPGIVAAVTTFLYHHGANITELDQHTGPDDGVGEGAGDGAAERFFMRLEFQTPNLDVTLDTLRDAFARVIAGPYGMDWRLRLETDRLRLGLMVSAHDHALMELLWRWQRGQLPVEIPVVVSNHDTLRAAVEGFGVAFEHVPIDASPASKDAAEARAQDIFTRHGVEAIALARYMRVLSDGFVAAWRHRIVNIHHSFLPAFVGADPYAQADARGVKIIGATAHYVTADLDEGPIIEQDVARVSHRHGVADLKALGRDLERRVLARAVQWHAEDRVVVHGNKTVVFAA